MPYYSWFHGYGYAILGEELGAADPFALSPAQIVERVVAAGYRPWVDTPEARPFPTNGTLSEVEHKGLTYLVSVSRDAQEINVQERRDEAYERVG